MRQSECVEFLQWCLPRLRMRWPGFRKVRSQVCKRLARRLRELDFDDLDAYRRYLQLDDEEWKHLDSMCRVTVSRFYRDHGVFEALETDVLPALAAAAQRYGEPAVRVWSCGCASGEEAYALAVVWEARISSGFPGVALSIVGTDADSRLLARARRGVYSPGSVRELPLDLRRAAFEGPGEPYRVRHHLRELVSWRHQDVRTETPPGSFDLVLCRNLALTYFEESLQLEVMARVGDVVRSGGALVVGSHESLPPGVVGWEPWGPTLQIYRRLAPST